MEKIHIKTYGCTLNLSDSEALAGILKKAGYELVPEDDAELVIVNTCIVKGPTESKILDYLRKLESSGKKIVVAGCMPQAISEKISGFSMIGVDQLSNIISVVEETLNGNTVTLIAREKNQRLNIPKVRKNRMIEIIPICAGCLGECSYCIVKRARGDLVSYERSAIIEQAQSAVTQGAKEIWITAQDTGCYGKDIGETLPDLLRSLIRIPGDFRIRLGMMNPDFVKEYIDELVEIFRSDKMFRFIHIPVQAGSNDVLKKMKRKYLVEDFFSVIDRLRKDVPRITISTDLICGFPGETEEQFTETMYLLDKTKPDVVNISRFWNRPHTSASRMKQLDADVIQSRSRRLSSRFIWLAFENSKTWAGWQGEVIVDEQGKDGTWIARNYAYKQVILKGDYKLGQKVNVRVIKTTEYDLRAIEI